MAYPLSMLSGMPKGLVETLAQEGVVDSEGLLAAGRLPRQRDALAAASAVDATEVDVWVSVADLVRVSLLTPQSAELIVRSGVARDVRELANAFARSGAGGLAIDSVSVHSEGEDAVARFASSRERLEGFAAARRWAARVPWDADLALAAEEAANLSPRLVGRTEDLSKAERERLRSIQRSMNRVDRRVVLLTFLPIGAIAGIGSAVGALAVRARVEADVRSVAGHLPQSVGLELLELGRELGTMVASASVTALGIVILSIVLFFVAMSAFRIAVWTLWTRIGFRFILRDVPTRRQYLDVEDEVAQAVVHFNRTASVFIAVVTVLAVGLMAAWMLGGVALAATYEVLSIAVAVVLVPMTIASFWPRLRALVRRYRRARPADTQTIRALMMIRVGGLVVAVLLVIALLQGLGPVVGAGVRVAHHVAEPRLEHARAFATARFDRILTTEHSGVAFADLVLRRWDDGLAAFLAVFDGVSTQLLVFSRNLLPSLLLVLALGIVVPFLLLGGWLRGAFFFVLLAAIAVTETGAREMVTTGIAEAFGLAEDSIVILAGVGFAVFGNAILFEWVYETTLERKPACVACGGAIDCGSRYCSHCGIEQA